MLHLLIHILVVGILWSTPLKAQPPYISQVDADTITFQKAYAENYEFYTDALIECLITSFSKEYYTKKNLSLEPTLEAAFYERQCKNQEHEAFVAIYSLLAMEVESFKSDIGKKKADQSVRDLKEIAFRHITKEYHLSR